MLVLRSKVSSIKVLPIHILHGWSVILFRVLPLDRLLVLLESFHRQLTVQVARLLKLQRLFTPTQLLMMDLSTVSLTPTVQFPFNLSKFTTLQLHSQLISLLVELPCMAMLLFSRSHQFRQVLLLVLQTVKVTLLSVKKFSHHLVMRHLSTLISNMI